MSNEKRTFGVILTRFALSFYFIVTGLCLLGVGGSEAAKEISTALSYVRLGDAANIVRIILAVIILLCGAILFIRFFCKRGAFDWILLTITLLVWIFSATIIAFSTFPSSLQGSLYWLLRLSQNLLVIAGLLVIHF